MSTLTYKRWTYKYAGTPLEITTDKFKFPTDINGNLIIPKNKILVKIHYASVNPIDIKLQHAAVFPSLKNHGMGKDYSGEIVAIGSNIKNFNVGDFVQGFHAGMLSSDGTFSEYLLINTKLFMFKTEIAKVPNNTSLEQAAAWPLVLGTSMLLIDKLKIKDKKVLVLGGATSVGRYLTQLLNIEGASEVVVSCSPRSQLLVEELGATSIINYRGNVLNQVLENVKDKPFDYIFDCWGGTELFPNIKEILVKGGVYRTIVGDYSGANLGPLMWAALVSLCRLIASSVNLLSYSYNFVLIGNKNPGWITKAQKYIASGKVKIFIDKVYRFEELPEAIEYSESGTAQGKLIIKIDKDSEN